MGLNRDEILGFFAAGAGFTLKIVLYTHDWAPLVGGIQTICTGLASELSLWSMSGAGEALEFTLVTQTPADGMDDSQLPFKVVRRPSMRMLFRLIRSADVLHVAGPALVPLTIGWLLRRPTLLEHHGYQSICPNGILVYGPDHSVCPGHFMARRYRMCVRCNSRQMGWAKSLRNLLMTFPRRWLARRVTVNVAPSRHIRQRVALPRTCVIYHGVPAPQLATVPHNDGERGRSACFAYVGRLATEKGLPVLLRACQQLKSEGFEFRLKIIGDGPERLALERMAQEFGIKDQTEFAGSVALAAIPAALRETTAVVMPSVCEDVAPLVAIEQMMQGRLVIASNIGGLGETVDGVGLKFPTGDVGALTSCMRQVLEKPELAITLGGKALRYASETFTQKRMAEDHLRLYQKISNRMTDESRGLP